MRGIGNDIWFTVSSAACGNNNWNNNNNSNGNNNNQNLNNNNTNNNNTNNNNNWNNNNTNANNNNWNNNNVNSNTNNNNFNNNNWNNNNNNCRAEVVGLTLVHAGRSGDIRALYNYDFISTDCGAEVNIRADVGCQSQVRSIEFNLNGSTYRIESSAPYALEGDYNGYYKKLTLNPGQYYLVATPWSGTGATGTRGISYDIYFTVTSGGCNNNNNWNNNNNSNGNNNNNYNNNNNNCTGQVAGFTLVRAGTSGDVAPLQNGDVISTSCKLNIRADVVCLGSIRSVVFYLNGSSYKIENATPYALGGDAGGSYHQLNLQPGNYHLKSTPWSGANGTGRQGASSEVFFSVSSSARNCLTNNNNNNNNSGNKMQGGNQSDDYGIKVYPNPNRGEFDVKFDMAEVGDLKIVLYDLSGEALIEDMINGFSGSYHKRISLLEYPAGMYFMSAWVNGREVATDKILYIRY